MRVTLHHPRRTVDIAGPKAVVALLAELDLNRESVLVVANGSLIPGDAMLPDDAEIEIRPVISGGSW